VLAALVALSTLLRSWAGLRVPTPWIAADEMIYAELGRSLWETGRLAILGQDTAFYSLVHPALVGLPLALFDTGLGYDVARVLQALTMSLTAVPVFLWGRRLMSEGWALAASSLTLAIPGLAYSGLLMTETVFYPAVTLAAWAAWRSLVAPTLAAQALLVGAVGLAVLTRLQGIVLVPAFALAVVLFAAASRSPAPVSRLWPALASLVGVGAAVLATGFGAYAPAGTVEYDVGGALRFVLYHAADLVLLAGVVPACAVALLCWRPERSPEMRAYLAVTLAFAAGFVAQVGLFASRYVGRLAERDLIGVAPLLFLGLCLWLARGAPRPRLASAVVALGAAALVFALPLGRLVHQAALPDAFTFVPVWKLGDYELVVWSFVGVAVVAFAVLPGRAIVALPVALAAVFLGSSVWVSRYVADEATVLKTSFFGEADPSWVDAAAGGEVGYVYDGEPFWNAVWSYVFWNRDIRRVYVLGDVLGESRRVPGPLPQSRVDPFPLGELAETAPPYVVASTALAFPGSALIAVDQTGLFQRGLVLWETEPPLRLRSSLTGVQWSGDIVGPASLAVYGCTGGTFELTLIAKGAPVEVRLETGAATLEHAFAPGEVWRPSVPAPVAGLCTLTLTPSGIVGSTRLEYIPG
jgi:hypothetical protein